MKDQNNNNEHLEPTTEDPNIIKEATNNEPKVPDEE